MTKQNISLAVLGALSLALLGAGCGKKADDAAGKGEADKGGAATQNAAVVATAVRVAPARDELVQRKIAVTGSISALQTVSLSPKMSAKVISVGGREGADVRAGQVVVQQDTTDLQNQLQQARANLQSAQAQLAQAQTQVGLQSATSSQGVTDAQQALQAAQQQLSLAKRPQRTQEVNVAENNVAQAQANYERSQADRKRYEELVREGASAQITLDQYVTQEKVNKAALDSAREQLSIAQTGGRAENVRSAQIVVTRAESNLRLARANTQQNAVRRDAVRAAQATVAQNRAAVANAQQAIQDASIVAPIGGVISVRSTEPGQFATPGTSVMQIVALDTVFFEAQVPETDISSVQTGKTVNVTVDAYPGRKFAGTVSKIYPTANTASRNFRVRVVVPNAGRILRPGLFARGEVVAQQRRGVVVSKDAIVSSDGEFAVYVAGKDNKAVRRPVKIGIQTGDKSEILSGVQPGEQVIIAGQDTLREGAPIQIKSGADSGGGAAEPAPQQAAQAG